MARREGDMTITLLFTMHLRAGLGFQSSRRQRDQGQYGVNDAPGLGLGFGTE